MSFSLRSQMRVLEETGLGTVAKECESRDLQPDAWAHLFAGIAAFKRAAKSRSKDPVVRDASDLTAFLYQRDGDYCIGMISSRW